MAILRMGFVRIETGFSQLFFNYIIRNIASIFGEGTAKNRYFGLFPEHFS